jgi:hypothetical protein
MGLCLFGFGAKENEEGEEVLDLDVGCTMLGCNSVHRFAGINGTEFGETLTLLR